jgi:hypothetical protein
MSKVVKLSDYRSSLDIESSKAMCDGLVPIELALGNRDREQCLNTIAEYRMNLVHVRQLNDEPGTLLYLIGVSEAIWINKKIIEQEGISEEELKQRIDLIQIMENMKFSIMDNLWESISQQSESQVR